MNLRYVLMIVAAEKQYVITLSEADSKQPPNVLLIDNSKANIQHFIINYFIGLDKKMWDITKTLNTTEIIRYEIVALDSINELISEYTHV